MCRSRCYKRTWTGKVRCKTLSIRRLLYLVRAAVSRSQGRGRVPIVIADNLKTHMSIEVLACARTGLVELKEPLYLVYAFASDPAALVLFLTGSHSSLSTP